jgi:predicted anti-sigma-YlaC factor YlaD
MSRLVRIWRLFNLPCEGMTRLASQSLDRELERSERVALRSHSLYCTACRRYESQIKRLRAAMRRLTSDLETCDLLPGTGLPDEARERIKSAIKRN